MLNSIRPNLLKNCSKQDFWPRFRQVHGLRIFLLKKSATCWISTRWEVCNQVSNKFNTMEF